MKVIRRLFIMSCASVLGLFLLASSQTKVSKRADETHVSKQIDQLFTAVWKKEKLIPSKQSNDEEFLRRVWIDLVGQIPPTEQVLAFLKNTDRDKRRKEIEELLNGPLYAKNWADLWQAWLIGRDRMRFGKFYRNALHPWLEEAFAKNMRYDAFVRQIISAEGVSDENGQTIFLLRWSDSPANMAGQTVRLFMGVRLQCAQCHNHPYQKWTQEDFWSTAAFFARVRRHPVRDRDGKRRAFELLEGRRGDVTLPDTDKIIPPRFVIGSTPDMSPRENRRDVFAKLITVPENIYFSQALVNRLWAHFFGRGFVNPVDDFNESNKPSHPEVLERLARDFSDHGYDLKRLIRIIVSTNTYQLSSKPSMNNQDDRRHFSRALLRPLTPEQLFYSLIHAANLQEIVKARGADKFEEFLQNALNRFTHVFDNDEMNESLSFEGTIPQALFLMNSRFSNDVLLAKHGTLRHILDEKRQPSDRVEAIFIATLSRLPDRSEKQKFLSYLQRQGDRVEAYQDLFWVLLNSTEFLFNH